LWEKHKTYLAGCAFAMGVVGFSALSNADYVPINLGAYANDRFQVYQPEAAYYPEGQVVLGGVPFDIENIGGNNVWAAAYASGSNPRILDITINVSGVTEVDTLIQQQWGQPGPTSYTAVEFSVPMEHFIARNSSGMSRFEIIFLAISPIPSTARLQRRCSLQEAGREISSDSTNNQ
jgi:hypothetical protein